MVVASRVCPEELAVRKARLDLLTGQDVNQALGRCGLLMPESGEMQELLRIPLMLSLFIQASLAQDVQMKCETEKQLVDDYLDALCAKMEQDGERARYQAEAAVYLVLPAIAGAARKQNAPMNDRNLLAPVVRCRKMIDTRTLARAFPQWIGHGAEITGNGVSDEAWYGLIVHDMLWKRLGLLVRDETGGYQIRHQVLQEHLLQKDAANRSLVRKARIRIGAVIAGLVACAACALFLTHPEWLTPNPYSGAFIEPVPDRAVLEAVENREFDPNDPYYDHVTDVLRLAKAGDVWQQYGMGILFEDGTGVEKDYEIARQYYLLAASQNLPEAYLRLGIFYQFGYGVDVNMDTAMAYYQKAADLGSTDAMVMLGRNYCDGNRVRQSYARASALFQDAWEKGNAEAAYWLGNMYLEGRGKKQSYSQAEQLFRDSAEDGYAPAAEALGDLYSDENSGMADLDSAVKYYRMSADLGNDQAQAKLDALESR